MIGFLLAAAQWIWNGIQVVADITVHALSVIVGILWSGLKAAGSILAGLGRDTWKVFRATWDHVLKPAWTKVFKFVDAVQDRLERIFGPVLRKLNALRSLITGWWKKYIRPVLDLIDVTRRVLRVAAMLHIPFAAALDRELGELEAKIQRGFTFVLGKINEVINIVNRVVTLDGLFQRLALVRSLERDIKYAWRAAVNAKVSPIDAATVGATQKQLDERTLDDVAADTRAVMVDGGGPYASWVSEMAATVSGYLR